MPRDSLATVLRLRRLALEEATRELAAQLAVEDEAAGTVARIEGAIAAEQAAASRLDASDLAVEAFGRWLRRTSPERDAALGARARAETETVRARAILGAARAALEAAEAAATRRADAARTAALGREQAAIDEHAGRRPMPEPA